MKELRSICKSSDITWREFPNGTHNETILEPGFFVAIQKFLDRVARGAFHNLMSASGNTKAEELDEE